MTLLVEVLGVLVLGGVLSGLAGLGQMRPTLASTVMVAVVVIGLNFWANVWPQTRGFVQAHNANAQLTREQANAAGGAAFSVNEPFMAYAADLIPSHARVFIDCGPHKKPCIGQDWFTFRLTPRVFVAHPEQAQWAIFYGDNAAGERFALGWSVHQFAPGFAVAHAP